MGIMILIWDIVFCLPSFRIILKGKIFA
jgi:hypothetical protein